MQVRAVTRTELDSKSKKPFLGIDAKPSFITYVCSCNLCSMFIAVLNVYCSVL